MSTTLNERARRLAQRAGLLARKSRCGNVLENHGGYMIVDPRTGIPVAGWKYDLDAQEVIDFCTDD